MKTAKTAILVTFVVVLSGCQSLPQAGKSSGFKSTFNGKEFSTPFIRVERGANESNGTEFRGYRKVRRHWFNK